jgi:predicted RNase H-like HicB family nuclease
VENFITLTAIISNNHAGGFHAYIEEIPELSTEASSFEKASYHLMRKLQSVVKDTYRLKVDFRYKYVLLKNQSI